MVYETQFFGFTPQTCMLRMYIAFQDHLFHMMLVVEEVILKKTESIGHAKLTPSLIRRSTEKFLSSVKERFSHLFGKLEHMLLGMVLNIPPNILLPENKIQEQLHYTAEQFQALQDEIGQLDCQIKAEISAQQALKAELEEQNVVLAHLEKHLQWFDGLDNECREQGTSNLKECFAFLKKNCETLKDIVQKVEKPHDAEKVTV